MIYYGLVPAVTAFIFAANQTGMARLLPPELAIPYWLGVMGPLWLLMDGASRVAERVLRPWSPWAWVVLAVGSVAGMFAIGPYMVWYRSLYQPYLLPGADFDVTITIWRVVQSPQQILNYLGVPVFWISVNLLSLRLIEFPHYLDAIVPKQQILTVSDENLTFSDQNGSESVANNLPPSFLELVPVALGRTVIALQAEDHYVRVVTMKGDTLIRYKFSEALTEARRLDGLQVHRSFWVRRSAVKSVMNDGKGYSIELQNGLNIPVSRSYVGALKVAGLV